MVERLPTFESQLTPGIVRTPGVSVAAATAPARALGGVGRGLEAVGVGLEQQNARQRRQQEIDEAKRRDSEARRFKTESVALYTQKWSEDFESSKASATPGAKGFVDGFRKTTNKDIEDAINQLNIEDEDIREDVRGRLTDLQNTFIKPAATFQAAESLRNRVVNTQKAIQSIGNLAVTNPENYRDYLSQGLQTIDDSELSAKAKDTARRGFSESIAQATVAEEIRSDPSFAKERLNEGEFDDLLTTDQKSQVLGLADTAIRKRQKEAEAARKTFDKQAKDAVDDAVFVLDRGRVPDNLAQVSKIAGQSSEQAARLDEAIEDGQQIASFNLLSPIERQSVVAEISSQATASRRDVERLERFEQQHARLNQGMSEDPVMTAVGTGLVELPPIDPNDPDTLRNRIGVADRIEVTYGVPNSGLTRDETKELAARWTNMTTPQKIQSMATLEGGLGPDRFRIALEDIASEQPIAANAAAVAVLNPGLATEMLEGQRIIDESGKSVLPTPTDYLATANDTLGAAMQHSAAGRQAAIDAALAIDVFRRSQTGSLTKDDFNSDDFEQALLASVGGVVEWNDGQIIPPIPGIDADRFDDLMGAMNDADLTRQAGGQLKWPTGGNINMSDIREHGVLESIGDALYLVKVGDGYLVGPNGQTFQLNMRDLAPILVGRIGAQDRQGEISGALDRLFGPGGS